MIDTREMTFQFSIIKKNKNYNIATQCVAMRRNATQCDAMRREKYPPLEENNLCDATRRMRRDASHAMHLNLEIGHFATHCVARATQCVAF